MKTTTTTGFDPLRLQPLVVLAVTAVLAMLAMPISPARMNDGLFQVFNGGGSRPALTITHRDIDCDEVSGHATCTVLVGGQTLTVELDYPPPDNHLVCTATHGTRTVGCERIYNSGQGSDSAKIIDWLGANDAEAAAWQAKVPWWISWSEDQWIRLGLILATALAALAGTATWLAAGRPRPELPTRQRTRLAWATGVVAVVLPSVVGVLLLPLRVPDILAVMIVPWVIGVPAFLLMYEQRWLGGAITGRRADRLAMAAVVTATTFCYGAATAFWVLLDTGLID